MSWSLAKMITSGMIGLNTSGLALYFGPQLFEETLESSVYGTSEADDQFLLEKEWHEFSKQERVIYDKLKEGVVRFSEALQRLEKDKLKENSNIISHFGKVEGAEQELKQLYEQNKEILEQMSELGKKKFQVSVKQLDTDEKLKELGFHLDSLKSASSAMHGWGSSVKEFICAIENKDSVNCKDQGKKWFSLSSSSSSSGSDSSPSSATGGGESETQGKEALKQLQASKEQLEKNLKELHSTFKTNLWNFWNTSSEKEIVDTLKKNIDQVVENLKKSWEVQKNKLDDSVKKTQEKTSELNKSYEELKESYNKWEKIKKVETGIYTYKGLMDSMLKENLFEKNSVLKY